MPATCTVSYTVSDWGTGFVADVRVTNRGASAISGWTLAWTFGGDQTISSAWNATVAQSGRQVSATNVDWNAVIAPQEYATFGFQATYSGSNAAPTSFTLNGASCASS